MKAFNVASAVELLEIAGIATEEAEMTRAQRNTFLTSIESDILLATIFAHRAIAKIQNRPAIAEGIRAPNELNPKVNMEIICNQ